MAKIPLKGKRADLPDTRSELLRIATRIFAEQGFKATTIRQICSEANVNVALVNYHFSSKAELYHTVQQSLFNDFGRPLLVIADGVDDAESWQNAMRKWVEMVLALTTADTPPASHAARMIAMELVHRSDVSDEADAILAAVRNVLKRLLSMALGKNKRQVDLWANAIITQSLIYIFCTPEWVIRLHPAMPRDRWVREIGEHILESVFSKLSYRKPA